MRPGKGSGRGWCRSRARAIALEISTAYRKAIQGRGTTGQSVCITQSTKRPTGTIKEHRVVTCANCLSLAISVAAQRQQGKQHKAMQCKHAAMGEMQLQRTCPSLGAPAKLNRSILNVMCYRTHEERHTHKHDATPHLADVT